jgi:mevalonate kinase
MNTLNKILTKLGKEKVKLGAVDEARDIINNFKNAERILQDVQQVSQRYLKEYTNLKKEIDKLKNTSKIIISTENDVRKINNLIIKGDSVLKKINVQAKELGISVNTIKEYDELFDFSLFLTPKINEVDKLIREVKSTQN